MTDKQALEQLLSTVGKSAKVLNDHWTAQMALSPEQWKLLVSREFQSYMQISLGQFTAETVVIDEGSQEDQYEMKIALIKMFTLVSEMLVLLGVTPEDLEEKMLDIMETERAR